MARFYESITTRYGDTYTSADDNTSDFADEDTDLTLSGGVLSVGGPVQWNGQIDGALTELVVFNKKIDFTATDSYLQGSGVNGCHAWFVNCTFVGSGAYDGEESNQTQLVGPSNSYTSGNGGRSDTVGGTKSSDTTFNYYNCKFILDYTDLDNGLGMVVGDFIDCVVTASQAGTELVAVAPMAGGVVRDAEFDGSLDTAAGTSTGYAMEVYGVPDELTGVNLINRVIQTGQDLFFEDFEGINTIGYFSNSQDTKQLFQLSGTQSSINLVSPKAEMDANGSVWWRKNSTGKLIQSKRIGNVYYGDPALTEGRKDILLWFDTEVKYTTDNDPGTITTTTLSKSEKTYITGTDGVPEGTFDFTGRTSPDSNQDFSNIDIPIQVLTRSGTGDDVFVNTATELETDYRVFSLWGTTNSSETLNSTNDLNDSADDDGYFITPDTGNVLDPDDPVMSGYSETISNLTGVFTSTTSTDVISFDDMAAIYKYNVYIENIDFDDWTTSVVSGSSFDISDNTYDTIHFREGLSSASRTHSSSILNLDCPIDSNGAVTLKMESDGALNSLEINDLMGSDDGPVDYISPNTNVDGVVASEVGSALNVGGANRTTLSLYDETDTGTGSRLTGYTDAGSPWSDVAEIRAFNGASGGSSAIADPFSADGDEGVVTIYDDSGNWCVFNVTVAHYRSSINNLSTPIIFTVDSIQGSLGDVPVNASSTISQSATSLSGIDGYAAASTNGTLLKLDGGEITVEGKATYLNRFSSLPSDASTDFTMNNVDFTGTVELDGPQNSYYVFNDIPSSASITLTQPSGVTFTQNVIVTGTSSGDSFSTTDTNISIQKEVTVQVQFDSAPTTSDIGVFAWVSGTSLANAAADTVNTASSTYTVSVDGNNLEFLVTIPIDHDLYWSLAYDGYNIVRGSGEGVLTSMPTSISTSNLDFDTASFTTWGTVDVSASNCTFDGATSATDSYGVTINQTGTRIGVSNATDAKTRLWLRKVAMESDEFMKGFALNYIPVNLLTYNSTNLTIKNSERSRFTVSRTNDDSTSAWRLGAVIVDESDADQFDELTTQSAGEDINFTPSSNGASIVQIEAALDDQTDDIRGADDRTITDAYKEAKRAKNAAFS